MKRLVDYHLQAWKNRPEHKPLLIRGARQIGKTYAVRRLGESFVNIIEVNLELAEDAHEIFEKNLDPERILRELQLYSGEKIIPGKTLVFFDEIQAVPKALTALRYFYERIPGLHVIAAGSLLDFAIEQVGVPVGRIANLYMQPLSFMEFLSAIDQGMLIEAILEQKQEEMPTVIHNKLLDFLGHYLAIGGMPEAVDKWIKTQNAKESFEVHHQIIENYQMDFRKYAKQHQVKFLEQLYSQIPHLVGQQFQYKNVHG
ncbi:MAG: AAA family ATPase, partial [Chlamydiia bacterium]|nr:AAA family ATPase [Chlamydiia bacterium]